MKKLITLLVISAILVPVFAYTPEELSSSMMANNTDIRKAREEVTKANLDLKDAKAGYSPTIDLTVTGSYIANPIDPIRINLGDYIDTSAYGVRNDYITMYQGQENMYYQFSLSMTQPIFTWGKLSNAVKLYQNIYDARLLQLEDATDKAQTELNTRIAALHYLVQIQSMLVKQTEIANRLVALAEDANRNGMMLAADALGVKVQARKTDVAKTQIDQQILLMMTELGNITGITELKQAEVQFNEASFESILEKLCKTDYGALSTKCLSDTRTNFRLLGKLSTSAQIANNIAGASVNWKPDFALVVNADYSGSRLPFVETDWYGKDDWSATVTVALKTTVLDGGKAVRNVKRTQSEFQNAQIDIQSAKSKVRSAVDENWTNLSVGLAQIDYQNALAMQLEEKNQVNRSLLDTGYGSESDYLQGQLERNNCEIEILRTKISLATSVYTLLYLQGDGSRLSD